jgi:REP element-mobilizing transposase RayT
MENHQKPERRSIRLKGYDYSQPGAYFVTIVVQGRRCVLGKISDRLIRLTKAGEIVERTWLNLPRHYPNAQLDEFCIMPNHVHGIIVLTDCRGGSLQAEYPCRRTSSSGLTSLPAQNQTRPYTLAEIVRAFKSFSARWINKLQGTPGRPFWQRGDYEHVIRDEKDLRRIREYIYGNPGLWEVDHENPELGYGKYR